MGKEYGRRKAEESFLRLNVWQRVSKKTENNSKLPPPLGRKREDWVLDRVEMERLTTLKRMD